MRDLHWPHDPDESVQRVLGLVQNAVTVGHEAVIRLVIARTVNDDAWWPAFGRIDLASEAAVSVPSPEDLGRVRVLVERMPAEMFLGRLLDAIQGAPLRIQEQHIDGHRMNNRWSALRAPSCRSPGGPTWPVTHARTETLPWPGGEITDILEGRGAVAAYHGIDDVIRAVSGLRPYHGFTDGRRNVINLFAWDERGRIDSASITRTGLRVFARADVDDAKVIAFVATDRGRLSFSQAARPVVDLVTDALPIEGHVVLRAGEDDLDEAWCQSRVEGDQESAYSANHMSSAIREKLKVAREGLAGLEPYPWSAVEAWIASARPLVRAGFSEHLEDFDRVTTTPSWTMLPRFMSQDDPWTGRRGRDNLAEAAAAEEKSNRKKANEARDRIFGFIDTLLDLPVEVPASPAVDLTPVQRLVGLLDRFSAAVRTLAVRRKGRQAVTLDDEYDVQYVLGALLAASFADVRPEEWTPSYAGSASRVDFLLKREKIVVEAKFARQGHASREITDELIIDKERYRSHPDCDALVCFVYDPQHCIVNQAGFEDDLAQDDNPKTIVMVRPR